jgi:hypothetical protein
MEVPAVQASPDVQAPARGGHGGHVLSEFDGMTWKITGIWRKSIGNPMLLYVCKVDEIYIYTIILYVYIRYYIYIYIIYMSYIYTSYIYIYIYSIYIHIYIYIYTYIYMYIYILYI